jgi:SNF2 family DNA or RNA helicase
MINGKKILDLPDKKIEMVSLDFENEEEKNYYNKFFSDYSAQFTEYQENGTLRQNYTEILVFLLRLRQICDHPFLVLGKDTNFEDCKICEDIIENMMEISCGHKFCSNNNNLTKQRSVLNFVRSVRYVKKQ